MPQRSSRASPAVPNNKSRSGSRPHQLALMPSVCGGAQGTELIMNSAGDCSEACSEAAGLAGEREHRTRSKVRSWIKEMEMLCENRGHGKIGGFKWG